MFLSRLIPFCGDACRRYRMAASGGFTFTSTKGMVNRIHGNSPYLGPLIHPARPSGLADADVGVIGVADLANGGAGVHGRHGGRWTPP